MHFLNEQNILLFLVQLFLLLFFTRGLGEVFRRIHQPPLTAEILVGIIFGPTLLGRLSPSLYRAIFPSDPAQNFMLETVAWLGVFFLLLEAGLEIDVANAWRQRADALKIALAGIVIPMVITFCATVFIPDSYLVDPSRKLLFALFMATVMSITALTIVARILQDLSLNKTDMGLLVLTALSINDVLGWLIFTVVLILFTSSQFVLTHLVSVFSFALIFVVVCLTVGRRLTEKMLWMMKKNQMPEPSSSLTFICLLGILCGAIAQKIGLQALLGFLIAGIMASGAKALSERTRHIISQMVYAIFVQLFFENIGLRIDFIKNFDLFLVFFIGGLSIFGKFIGAWVGTLVSSVSKEVRVPIAIAHIPGGVMEIVVGALALENHLITEKIFVAIICSSVGSSMLVGPWLSYSIKRRKQVSVVEFFLQRVILSDIRVADRESAIVQLCELVGLQKNMPPTDIIVENVLKREREMGTALADGIAVPHARLSGLTRPVIAFARSLSGIDWDSSDGKPAQMVFLILTPASDDALQIQILRAIARVTSDEKMRRQILKAADNQKIWDILHHFFTAQSISQ